MPRRDGTGPMGFRGRRFGGFGRGGCAYMRGYGYGMGPGYGMGYGYGMGPGYGMRGYAPRFEGYVEDEMYPYDISEEEALSREKELLESRLQVLNRELDSLRED